MLRCGVCGEAMLPRSDSDTYVCRSHKLDAESCAAPVLKRAAVDGAALALFTTWALDVDGTRQRVMEASSQRAGEARAQADRADREAAGLQAKLDRVERDYLAGDLPAAEYARLRDRLTDEHTATSAQRDRLLAHAEQVEREAAATVAEVDVLARIDGLYEAISQHVRTARDLAEHEGDIGAVRAALASLFESVSIIPARARPYERQLAEVGDGYVIEPLVRLELVEDRFSDPRLRRVTLNLDSPDNQTGTGVPL
jgi:hypothetical protein